MGVSGNTVRDLQRRWQTDVMDLRPDWLSICIGINDVWRQFDTPFRVEWQVPLEEYASALEELVKRTMAAVKGLVLMTPYFIEPNRAEPMRARMDEYGSTVKRITGQYQAILVDTQAAFDAVLAQYHPSALTWDRIHPTRAGHMVLARAFLQAVGYEW